MKRLSLDLDRAKYLDDRDNYPKTAILVGGNPAYGNVRKLPVRLWEECGIAVIRHVVKESDLDQVPRADMVVVLVDQTGTHMSRRASSLAPHTIRTSASWSELCRALTQRDLFGRKGAEYTWRDEPKPEPLLAAQFNQEPAPQPGAAPDPVTVPANDPAPSSYQAVYRRLCSDAQEHRSLAGMAEEEAQELRERAATLEADALRLTADAESLERAAQALQPLFKSA